MGMRTLWIAVALAAAALLAACSDDAPNQPTPGSTVEATATPQPAAAECPVAREICDFAREIEDKIQARDWAAIAATSPGILDGLRQQGEQALPAGTPRLVSIGCPDGGAGDSCGASFSLVFTTLQPTDDWTGSAGILLVRYERRTAPLEPQIRGVHQLTERETRRSALAGGNGYGPCNLSGIAPPQTEATCTGTVFHVLANAGPPFTPIDVPPVNPFVVLPVVPPPPDSVLFVQTGCYGCEGYSTGIARVQTRSDGLTTVTNLPEPPLQAGEQRTELAMLPDASLIVAGTCRGTNCGPLGVPTTDVHSRILTSKDGGFTWTEVASLPGYAFFEIGPGGQVLIGRTFGDRPPEDPATYQILGGEELIPPPNATREHRPMFLADGSIAWWRYEEPVLLRPDGSEAFRMPGFTAAERVLGIEPMDTEYLVRWSSGDRNQGAVRSYWSLVDAAGTELLRRELGLGDEFMTGAALSDGLFLGNVIEPGGPYGRLPALVDAQAGTVQPFGEPFGTTVGARNWFVAMLRGPYAVVEAPGDCLNIRQSPSTSAASVACVKHESLLRVSGEKAQVGETVWVPVQTLDGHEGWVSRDFLAR